MKTTSLALPRHDLAAEVVETGIEVTVVLVSGIDGVPSDTSSPDPGTAGVIWEMSPVLHRGVLQQTCSQDL